MTVEGYELVMSPAIGFSLFPQDGVDYEALSHKAEIALTYAKQAGRNTFKPFSAPMEESAARRRNLHNDLRVALEREQLVLHYQPQVRLADGKVVGIEALLRWNHPDHGIIPPGEFISIAERCGLIIPLGEWVLHQACRQTAKWQEQGMRPTTMAVNVSAQQFRRGNLEKIVYSALAKSGLSPQWLELEMTESLLAEDAENIKGIIGRLAKRGVLFSIDDFGTGCSSLAYLRQFAVDKLKIDRSFISDLDHNTQNLAIVKAILQIAGSLGLETIAEGVEDHRTLTFLQNEGCGLAQGYLFSKPVPAEELEIFMTSRAFH
jgi:EAL domain-containing protein (putative c-di-GMP-specific phosphodiesterase class I)